ncbi:unnamed protein product, partial [Ectocarpus sp. 12 AP-2014]
MPLLSDCRRQALTIVSPKEKKHDDRGSDPFDHALPHSGEDPVRHRCHPRYPRVQERRLSCRQGRPQPAAPVIVVPGCGATITTPKRCRQHRQGTDTQRGLSGSQ